VDRLPVCITAPSAVSLCTTRGRCASRAHPQVHLRTLTPSEILSIQMKVEYCIDLSTWVSSLPNKLRADKMALLVYEPGTFRSRIQCYDHYTNWRNEEFGTKTKKTAVICFFLHARLEIDSIVDALEGIKYYLFRVSHAKPDNCSYMVLHQTLQRTSNRSAYRLCVISWFMWWLRQDKHVLLLAQISPTYFITPGSASVNMGLQVATASGCQRSIVWMWLETRLLL
jgi:hypothetical protein